MDWNDYYGLASVPVIIGVVGVFRGLLKMPAEWAPLLAVICGVGWNLLVSPLLHSDLYPSALLGVIAGLAAAGLFDVVKKGITTFRG